MKKYIVLALLFLPVVSMAAPSVKKFGSMAPVASGGVKSSVAAKVTPAKTITASLGANTARVGSIRLKSNATGSATGENTGTSGSRLSGFPSLKVYSSASALKTTSTGSGAQIAEINILNQKVTNLENQEGGTTIVTNVDTLVNHDDTISIGAPWASGDVEGRTENSLPDNRAWIWVETAD